MPMFLRFESTFIVSICLVVSIGLAFFSLALAGAAPENTDLPEGLRRITSIEGITEYGLDNGLRVLLFPDPSKPTITVNITYLVGSKHEN